MEELRGVEEKWRLFGRELRVTGMDDIRYPDPTDCLIEVVRRKLVVREMVTRELKSIYTTTWGEIVVALRKAGEPHLADNLKVKYISGELTTTSSQYSLESEHEECILLYCD